MRRQKITRVVDAMAGQNRMILWLECTHKVSLDARTVMADTELLRTLRGKPTHWDCPFCEDPPSEDVRATTKTATQLYKEAGEP